MMLVFSDDPDWPRVPKRKPKKRRRSAISFRSLARPDGGDTRPCCRIGGSLDGVLVRGRLLLAAADDVDDVAGGEGRRLNVLDVEFRAGWTEVLGYRTYS